MAFNRNHTRTSFISVDTQKCKACWKCIETCPNQVIGKVDLPWHKHAIVVQPDNCTGCLDCVSTCEHEAYSRNDRAGQNAINQRKRTVNNFLINLLLLVSGLIMIYSGLVLQIGFHMGGPHGNHSDLKEIQSPSIPYEELREIDMTKIVMGFSYHSWSDIHKIIIVLFSSLIIYHTYIHWKWYQGVIKKRLFGRNKEVISLSILFLLVALTGFIPWIADMTGSSITIRLICIEIHDKLTFILIFFLGLHFVKRAKWYTVHYKKLINN